MGGCHTVVSYENKLLGDPIEQLFFDNSTWKFDQNSGTSFNSKKNTQKIVKKFVHSFRSDLKRMSSCAVIEGFEGKNGVYSLVKGAPEILGTLLANKPDNYDK